MEEKEEKQKVKLPKYRIVVWEEIHENERKEKEKEEREGRPTLAALTDEQLLRSMPSDEMGVPPEVPPPYLLADRTKIHLLTV